MSREKFIYAKNLPIGSIVEMYPENWTVLGVVTFCDGSFSFERVLLKCRKRKKFYTLLVPYEEMYQIGPDSYSTLPF